MLPTYYMRHYRSYKKIKKRKKRKRKDKKRKKKSNKKEKAKLLFFFLKIYPLGVSRALAPFDVSRRCIRKIAFSRLNEQKKKKTQEKKKEKLLGTYY